MTDTDLDQVYAALCEAMAQVGQGQTPLLLSMLCLSLISRSGQASDVLDVADQGTGAGQIGHANGSSTITYGGAVIGTLAGGTAGTTLTVTLTSNATPAATQGLMSKPSTGAPKNTRNNCSSSGVP